MKFLIVFVLFCILGSLARALYFLIRDPGNSKRTVRALTWRIGLSLALFVLLILALVMGWFRYV
jgi:hypothetical protein